MPNQTENHTDLKILVGLGVVALAVITLLPIFWYMYFFMSKSLLPLAESSVSSTSGTAVQGRLGELGSTCGGSSRLPCRPGLACSTGSDFTKYGVCEKPSQEAVGQNRALAQLGESCLYDFHSSVDCVPGLVCKLAGGIGTCTAFAASDVNIVSVKLDGAEPSDGLYFMDQAAGLGITVTAVNAKEVKQLWTPEKGAKSEASLERQPGGVYANPSRTSWQEASGTLTIRAFAENGDFMTLDYRIATKE